MKRSFRIEVVRTNIYEVEIDETIYNSTWREEFAKSFYPLDNLEEMAKDLAIYQARFGKENGFIEGYGYVNRNEELPFSFEDYDQHGHELPLEKRRQPEPGINIIIVDEDEDIDANLTEYE